MAQTGELPQEIQEHEVQDVGAWRLEDLARRGKPGEATKSCHGIWTG